MKFIIAITVACLAMTCATPADAHTPDTTLATSQATATPHAHEVLCKLMPWMCK